ncbi:MAG: flagellar hook-length control protein FliK [Alphaproteobacteria bacterium]|nr:flagellar hook-length control protein FliK [Alphaproteobacteria bacterium]
MEIQDRNSIMQLALNFNFDSKNLSSAGEIGFINMIKNVPVDNNVKTPAFDTSKSTDALVSEKSKAPRLSNKNSSDSPVTKSSKKTTAKASDKAEKKVVTQNNKQEAAPAAVNSPAPQDDVQAQSSTEATYVQVEDNIENTSAEVAAEIPAITENTETMVAENLWDLGKIFNITEPAVSAIEQSEVIADEADLENNVVTSVAEDTNTHKAATYHQNDNPLNMPLDEKSDLLIQQAQHLDTKIGTSHHLKIDVNVNEAKIAAPIENNILQNSFAITSMLQGDNMIDTPINVENFIEGEQILTNNNAAQNNTEAAPQPVNSAFVANISASQPTSLSASEDVAMINSIHPVELSISHLTAKNELSSRLQEINDDASLKGLGKEVIEQIKVNITKSAIKGVDTINIELKPEELGKVQVRMYISKDGKLHADIIASRQETSDLLQREVESLSKSFQDAGYDTNKQNFNFSSQEERQANHNREENKLQQFIGEALAQESEPTGVNDNLAYDPKVGLNIRV